MSWRGRVLWSGMVLAAVSAVWMYPQLAWRGARPVPRGWTYDFDVEHTYLDVNGVQLHALETPAAGPRGVLLFLHGFPQSQDMWHEQLKHFSARGYKCVAIDQRGYFLSEGPPGIAAYSMKHLVEDVRQVIERLRERERVDRVTLVAHDWGGAVAWAFAALYPDMLQHLVVINIPHPGVMERTLMSSLEQLRASWYIAFFQRPILPERLIANANLTALFGAAGVSEHTKQMWAMQSWTHPINYYRALPLAMFSGDRAALAKKIFVPTTIIWGRNDAALTYEMAQPSADMCVPPAKLHTIEDASHWVVGERPHEVNRLIDAALGN